MPCLRYRRLSTCRRASSRILKPRLNAHLIAQRKRNAERRNARPLGGQTLISLALSARNERGQSSASGIISALAARLIINYLVGPPGVRDAATFHHQCLILSRAAEMSRVADTFRSARRSPRDLAPLQHRRGGVSSRSPRIRGADSVKTTSRAPRGGSLSAS
jgi:hypothetical protein